MTDHQEQPKREPVARPKRRDLAAAKATLAEIREANSRANVPRRGRWKRRRG